MLLLPSGQETETKHVYLSPLTLASSPPMMSIYGSWSQECSQRGLNITLKPTLPLPSSLLGTWAPTHSLSFPLSPLSHKHSQVQDSGEGCGCIKMEGALQVLKPRTGWETPFLQPGLGRRRRPERVNGGVLSTVRIKDIQELKMGSLSKLASMESHRHIIISGVLERPAITFLFLSMP